MVPPINLTVLVSPIVGERCSPARTREHGADADWRAGAVVVSPFDGENESRWTRVPTGDFRAGVGHIPRKASASACCDWVDAQRGAVAY
jgi:hypothetical protein